jgi:fimbrial chaperone protein
VRHPVPTGALAVAATIFCAQMACAADDSGISVNKTMISFHTDENAQALIVTDVGTAPVRVQARLFSWHGGEGGDVYSATQDIGFSPAIFAIQPGSNQVVRLVSLAPRSAQETAYRLFIDELPPPAHANSVMLPVRFVIPVFVQGLRGTDKSSLSWQANVHAGHATLTAINGGSAHARIVDLAYDENGGRHVVAPGLSGYVLAGERRSWSFPFRGNSLEISARTEQGDIHQSVPLTAQ